MGISQRPRLNSTASSVHSYADGAYDGGEEPANTTGAAAYGPAFAGEGHSASADMFESQPQQQHGSNDWFHPSNNISMVPSVLEGGVNKGRGKTGEHPHEPLSKVILAMQNMSGPDGGNASHSSRRKKHTLGSKPSQGSRGDKLPQPQRPTPHPDPPRRLTGSHAGGPRGTDLRADPKRALTSLPGPQRPPVDHFVTESPSERQAFKEFGRTFRQRENVSLEAAREYALSRLDPRSHETCLPPATHWRVHLELADVAKRSNAIEDARRHYREACRLQPRASQGWLEHSKLEEECGRLDRCAAILREGLGHCATNENLLIRAVKFYERRGDLDRARQLLSRTKHLSIDKSWKTVLEGALLEARVGRYTMAVRHELCIFTISVVNILNVCLCFIRIL